MFETIDRLPDHVVGIKVTGKITADDYQQILTPVDRR